MMPPTLEFRRELLAEGLQEGLAEVLRELLREWSTNAEPNECDLSLEDGELGDLDDGFFFIATLAPNTLTSWAASRWVVELASSAKTCAARLSARFASMLPMLALL